MQSKREEMLTAYLGLQMAFRGKDHDSIMYALDRTVQDAHSIAELLATTQFLARFAEKLTEAEE